MRIALVGVENRINEILRLTHRIQLPIEITPFPYQGYQEVAELVKGLTEYDGILFSGFFPYSLAVKGLDEAIPTAYLEFNETSLIKLFYQDWGGRPPQTISLDSLVRPVIVHAYQELNLELDEIYLLSRDKTLTVEKVAAFHKQNAATNPDVQIITGWYSSHQQLLEAGFSSHLLTHTYFSVMGGLNSMINTVNFKDSSGNHPAVCIIQIDQFEQLSKTIGNELKVQQLLYRLKSYLLDFQEQLLAFSFEERNDRFSFSTTRKLIEHYTDHYREFPLLYEVYSRFHLTVSIGIGFGLNPMGAYAHAKEALSLALQQGNSARVLTDGGRVISPSTDESLIYQQKNFSQATLQAAEGSGIGPSNISKIVAVLSKRGSHHITAFDLAKSLGLTMRSGTRLMSQLLQAGYAHESGVEQPRRGRPRKVYHICLPE